MHYFCFCSFLIIKKTVHGPGPWQGVHGPGPWKWSMDPIQSGGPWTPGPCFVLTRFKLYFLLFLCMVMYDNDMIMGLKQEKIKFKPRIKLNHNMYMVTTVSYMHTVIWRLKSSNITTMGKLTCKRRLSFFKIKKSDW